MTSAGAGQAGPSTADIDRLMDAYVACLRCADVQPLLSVVPRSSPRFPKALVLGSGVVRHLAAAHVNRGLTALRRGLLRERATGTDRSHELGAVEALQGSLPALRLPRVAFFVLIVVAFVFLRYARAIGPVGDYLADILRGVFSLRLEEVEKALMKDTQTQLLALLLVSLLIPLPLIVLAWGFFLKRRIVAAPYAALPQALKMPGAAPGVSTEALERSVIGGLRVHRPREPQVGVLLAVALVLPWFLTAVIFTVEGIGLQDGCEALIGLGGLAGTVPLLGLLGRRHRRQEGLPDRPRPAVRGALWLLAICAAAALLGLLARL